MQAPGHSLVYVGVPSLSVSCEPPSTERFGGLQQQ